jgi:Polysaccharide pyruvyl transferase
MDCPKTAPLKVAWFSVATRCKNRGNLLIDLAARELFGLPRAAVCIDAFRELSSADVARANDCDCVVLAGATLLDSVEHPAVRRLGEITVPKIGFGVALNHQRGKVDLTVARMLNFPVGCRDPFTYAQLNQRSIESRLVGCPTLFCGSAREWRANRTGPVIVSLGLGSQGPQVECVKACAQLRKVIVVEHVPELQPWNHSIKGVRRLTFASAWRALELYSCASVVVTGRLHALLPCIALGVPVIFFSA